MSWIFTAVITAIAIYIGWQIIKTAFKAAIIVWQNGSHAASIATDVAAEAVAGAVLQLAAIAIGAAFSGIARAWAPLQVKLDGAAPPPPEEPRAVKDDYAEALEILGLKDGCTQVQVERRHKDIIRHIHPDVTRQPTEYLAARVNTAKDIIFKRNGWDA